ncbi:unnamed protein product, partial [Rotaria sp. Silwood1]
MDACPSSQLTHFYILNGQQVHFDANEFIIYSTCDDSDEDCLEMPSDSNRTFQPMAVYGVTHGHEILIRDLTKDQNQSFDRPFAVIAEHNSKRDEKEILFAMRTIFRVISVKEYDSACLIDLEVETQVQECLSKLTVHLRTDNMHPIASELTLGNFLLNMGELHQAQQFYAIMLQQKALSNDNDSEKALLYNTIVMLHCSNTLML